MNHDPDAIDLADQASEAELTEQKQLGTVEPPSLLHLILALAFGFMLVQLNADRLPRLGSETWPATTGTVMGTAMSVYHEEDGTSYQPRVMYEYTVGGQSFTGAAGGRDFASYSSQSEAEQMLRGFPRWRPITVYYNPRDPSRSVLVPGVHDMIGYIVMSLGGLAVVGSFAAFLFHWLLDRTRYALSEPE